MSTVTHEKCSKVLRSLRFDWTQDPEIVLNERLKTIGLESEYLKTDLEVFKVFHQKLYRNLEEKHQPLLDFVVPAHFLWQTTVIWYLTKCRSRDASTYNHTRKAVVAILTNTEEQLTLSKELEDSKETSRLSDDKK